MVSSQCTLYCHRRPKLYLYMLWISMYFTQLTLHKYSGSSSNGAVHLSNAVQEPWCSWLFKYFFYLMNRIHDFKLTEMAPYQRKIKHKCLPCAWVEKLNYKLLLMGLLLNGYACFYIIRVSILSICIKILC